MVFSFFSVKLSTVIALFHQLLNAYTHTTFSFSHCSFCCTNTHTRGGWRPALQLKFLVSRLLCLDCLLFYNCLFRLFSNKLSKWPKCRLPSFMATLSIVSVSDRFHLFKMFNLNSIHFCKNCLKTTFYNNNST